VASQLQREQEYKSKAATRQTQGQKKKKKKEKLNQFRLFTFKRKFLKISVGLEIALSAEANLAEGQRLEEQLT
jgi:hypothetical protein